MNYKVILQLIETFSFSFLVDKDTDDKPSKYHFITLGNPHYYFVTLVI